MWTLEFLKLRYSTDKVLASIGWNFCHLAIFSDRDLANTLWNSFANWFDLLLVYLTQGIILSILSSDSSNQSVPEQLAVERWRCWNPPEAKAARLGCVSGPNLLVSQGLKMENPDGYTRYHQIHPPHPGASQPASWAWSGTGPKPLRAAARCANNRLQVERSAGTRTKQFQGLETTGGALFG